MVPDAGGVCVVERDSEEGVALGGEDEEDGRTLVVGDEEEDKCIGADGGKA